MGRKTRPQKTKQVPQTVRNTQQRRFSGAAGPHKQRDRYAPLAEDYDKELDMLDWLR